MLIRKFLGPLKFTLSWLPRTIAFGVRWEVSRGRKFLVVYYVMMYITLLMLEIGIGVNFYAFHKKQKKNKQVKKEDKI